MPGSADTVAKVEVKLGTVESAVAFIKDIFLAHISNSRLKSFLCVRPNVLVTHMVLGHGRKLDLVCKTKEGIYLVKQRNNVLYLVTHLLFCHKDMSIVLSKATNTEQAVKCAGKLVAVYQTKLACTERKVAVGVRLVHIN